MPVPLARLERPPSLIQLLVVCLGVIPRGECLSQPNSLNSASPLSPKLSSHHLIPNVTLTLFPADKFANNHRI